ncbi:MAG: acetate CoA-transferase subunit alpha [Clostridia bacterium]|nr:acetate CoA-transferase subunit alpha [Clostridia bacterium]
MINKVVTLEEALSFIQDGQRIMVGGFLNVGAPLKLLEAIYEKGTKDLTVISNDTSFVDKGVGKLLANNQIKKVIGSYIGSNPETGKRMNDGRLEVELVPQGTFAERIRCGGAGLGGFLTPTGVGTIVEEGKEILEVNGKKYLLELPLKADIALIKAYKADTFGNLVYRGTARNFNPLMAMAADLVIVEAEEIVEVGALNPEEIVTPGIFVDKIIQG